MATIKQFKSEIAKLAKKQKDCKLSNSQWEQYMNRGVLHASYTAYYILKHNVDAQEYIKLVLNKWTHKHEQGWRGYSVLYGLDKYFEKMVIDLISKYGDEEVICTDKSEA